MIAMMAALSLCDNESTWYSFHYPSADAGLVERWETSPPILLPKEAGLNPRSTCKQAKSVLVNLEVIQSLIRVHQFS
jgi:hypothetical protein